MRWSLPAHRGLPPKSGLICLLVLPSLLLSVASTSAAGRESLSSGSTLETCGRTPSTPSPLRTDLDGLSWQPMLHALPAVVNPSAAEELYLTAISEVHRHVRIDGSRIGMAMTMYSICEIDSAALGGRVAVIGGDLDQAEAVLASLSVPERFGAVHANYLRVIGLYRQGLAEMVRTTDDDNPEHLRDAFPFTKSASDGLADLEALVWSLRVPDVGQPPTPGTPIVFSAE